MEQNLSDVLQTSREQQSEVYQYRYTDVLMFISTIKQAFGHIYLILLKCFVWKKELICWCVNAQGLMMLFYRWTSWRRQVSSFRLTSQYDHSTTLKMHS